jgi:ribosomal protein L6P/L9E
VSVKGPKGELSFDAPAAVRVVQEDNAIKVEPAENSKFAKAMYGTARARINNMVQGRDERVLKRTWSWWALVIVRRCRAMT